MKIISTHKKLMVPAVESCLANTNLANVTEVKGFACQCISKPNKMRAGVCSKESKDLFKELAPSLRHR